MACHFARLRRDEQRRHFQVVSSEVGFERRPHRSTLSQRPRLDTGAQVRVKCGVLNPRYGWGRIRPEHVGTIERITNNKSCRVRFPSGLWKGALKELESVNDPAGMASQAVLGMCAKLYEDRQFADVTFVLADGEERAHKAVLAASSDAFSAMFTQPMQEHAQGKVDLRDTRAVTMRTFLRLIYTGRVDPRDWQDEVSEERVHFESTASPASSSTVLFASNSVDFHEAVPPKDELEEVSYSDTGDDDDVLSDNSAVSSTSSLNDVGWPPLAKVSQPELPLTLLLDVAQLAHRYMASGVFLQLVEALRLRLFRYFVEFESGASVDEELYKSCLQDIIAFARRNDVLVLRAAAVQMARRSTAMKTAYKTGKLYKEVRQELAAAWPSSAYRVAVQQEFGRTTWLA